MAEVFLGVGAGMFLLTIGGLLIASLVEMIREGDWGFAIFLVVILIAFGLMVAGAVLMRAGL